MFLKLDKYQHTISLDLNTGYYCNLTDVLDEASKLCTLVLPRMIYEYLWTYDENTQLYRYFQGPNNKLIYGFNFVCVYINDLLILTRRKKWNDFRPSPPPQGGYKGAILKRSFPSHKVKCNTLVYGLPIKAWNLPKNETQMQRQKNQHVIFRFKEIPQSCMLQGHAQ